MDCKSVLRIKEIINSLLVVGRESISTQPPMTVRVAQGAVKNYPFAYARYFERLKGEFNLRMTEFEEGQAFIAQNRFFTVFIFVIILLETDAPFQIFFFSFLFFSASFLCQIRLWQTKSNVSFKKSPLELWILLYELTYSFIFAVRSYIIRVTIHRVLIFELFAS